MANARPLDCSGFIVNMMRAELERQMGITHIEGLSFKVRVPTIYNSSLFSGRRVYDRPFTKAEYRADLWRRRRLRFKRTFTRPYREAKYRLANAWEALNGAELDRY